MKRRLSTRWCLAILSIVLGAAVVPAQASSDKPRIAVIEFQNGAGVPKLAAERKIAMQDVFVSELVKSGKFRVVEREQLNATISRNNLKLSDAPDKPEFVRIGKLLGVNYLLTGSVTEYGVTDKGAHGRMLGLRLTAKLIDTSTGEVAWTDEALHESGAARDIATPNSKPTFDKVMKPVIQKLTASLKAADL